MLLVPSKEHTIILGLEFLLLLAAGNRPFQCQLYRKATVITSESFIMMKLKSSHSASMYSFQTRRHLNSGSLNTSSPYWFLNLHVIQSVGWLGPLPALPSPADTPELNDAGNTEAYCCKVSSINFLVLNILPKVQRKKIKQNVFSHLFHEPRSS